MKPIFAFACAVILFTIPLNGQTYKQQFDALAEKRDTAGQLMLLEKWQATDSNNAELYVAWFNYYVNKSHVEILALGSEPEGEALELMSTDTAQKKPAGYLYGKSTYELDLLQKGFEYADKGIKKHPARLDIRFGKVYVYSLVQEWEKFTVEIIKAVDYSAVIKNKWLSTNNKPQEDPKLFMLSSIQIYQLQLYNTLDNALLENMKRIAEAILKHYPDHVESLSNLSIVYMVRLDYDKALETLFKAEKLAPKDDVVLGNIANAYSLKGDKKNAIKYYELVALYGDGETKEFATGKIEELKK